MISAAPTTALIATVNASTSLHAVATNLLGINTAYWDPDAVTTQTQQMATAAGLDMYRFPGGSAADDFHFNVANNYYSGDINFVQFVQFITSVGGTGVVTVDYGSGSPQEAAAELAYLDGSPTDTTLIGSGIEWNDATSQWQTVNWGTVGYWAALRAASPLAQDDGLNFMRIAHPAAFTDIKYWEIGNEEYGSWEVDHHGTATPGGVSTGAAHDPATYAAFAKQFASLASEIQTTAGLPQISIGIDSGDPTGASDGNWTKNVLADGLADGFVPGFISDHSYMQAPGDESDSFLLDDTVSDSGSVLDWTTRYADYQTILLQTLGSQAASVQVMATEYNSVYTNPGKQSTSLVNGLFVAESLGSLLDSGYTGGFVWDLRNAWDTSENDSNLLYGWREGGDYGQLGDPNSNSPPTTGPYVAYPGYYALQLASKIIRSGGQVVSATSNYSDLNVYAVMESSGDLDLLVINVNPAASLTEQFDLTGFQPGGSAQVWQYGETQDTAQSHSATGASALASASTSVSLSGSNFSYTFPAYSMTVLDLSPPPSLSGPTTATVGHTRNLAFSGATAISVSDSAATGSTIDTVALSVHNGTLAVSLSGGATITAGSSGSGSLTLSGTLTQLNAALGTLVYTAPTTGASDTLSATATDGIASSAPLATTITLTNIAPTVVVGMPATPQTAAVTISYILTDAESDPCSILVEYSPDGGTTWRAATAVLGQGDGTTGLASAPTGASHTFLWDSHHDIGDTNNSNVEIRITPSDAGGAGTAGTTSAFTVNDLSAYTVQTITDPNTGNIEYQMWENGFHFGTLLQTPQGAIGFRGHPDQSDVNGWGTTVQENVYIAGSGVDATGGAVTSAVAGATAFKSVPEETCLPPLGTAGTWNWTSTITYDPTAETVTLTGSTTVSLAAPLSGDMNVGRNDSNYLYDYPLNGGGVGPTGDMKSVTFTYGPDSSVRENQWTPLPGLEGTSPKMPATILPPLSGARLTSPTLIWQPSPSRRYKREIISNDPTTKLIVACNWDSTELVINPTTSASSKSSGQQNTTATSFEFQNTEYWTPPDTTNPTVTVTAPTTTNNRPVLTGTVSSLAFW